MEILNRNLQRNLLVSLSDVYPAPTSSRQLMEGRDARQVEYNLFYLRGHGLIEFDSYDEVGGGSSFGPITITVNGIDFISDDGGLSAALGVVTVRLHEDTIKAMLIGKVEASSEQPDVKKKLIEKIKGLPAAALGMASQQAMQQ